MRNDISIVLRAKDILLQESKQHANFEHMEYYVENFNISTVCKFCKMLRTINGDTVQDMADKLNINRPRIYRFERLYINDLELFICYMLLYAPYANIQDTKYWYDDVCKRYIRGGYGDT